MQWNNRRKRKKSIPITHYHSLSLLGTDTLIKTNFYEICIGGPKSKDFWSTIKPFIKNTGSHFSKDIILCENGKIINNQKEVGCFNDFFIYVAKNIGNNTAAETNHPSIDKINKNKINTPDHKFI
jgi:hypothetical protein